MERDGMQPQLQLASNVVDCGSPTANMYGCEPCPKCKSKYRWPQQGTDLIICDDCGFNEPGVYPNER